MVYAPAKPGPAIAASGKRLREQLNGMPMFQGAFGQNGQQGPPPAPYMRNGRPTSSPTVTELQKKYSAYAPQYGAAQASVPPAVTELQKKYSAYAPQPVPGGLSPGLPGGLGGPQQTLGAAGYAIPRRSAADAYDPNAPADAAQAVLRAGYRPITGGSVAGEPYTPGSLEEKYRNYAPTPPGNEHTTIIRSAMGTPSVRASGPPAALAAPPPPPPPSKYAGKPGYKEVRPHTPGTRAFVGEDGRSYVEQTTPVGPNPLQNEYYDPLRRGIDSIGRSVLGDMYNPLYQGPRGASGSWGEPESPRGTPAIQVSVPGSHGPGALPPYNPGYPQPQQPGSRTGEYGPDPGPMHPSQFPPNGTQHPADFGNSQTPIYNPAPEFQASPESQGFGPAYQPQPRLGAPGTPQEMERNRVFDGIRQRLGQRIMEKQANSQAWDQHHAQKKQGIANQAAQPTHFGSNAGGYGMQEPGLGHYSRAAVADSIIDGNAPPPAADPRFAGMEQRFSSGAPIKPHPADPTPLSTKDMDSRNGYGLNRGPGEMNLQSRMTNDEAANAKDGQVIGRYGNSSLIRRGGKNVLVGDHSPSGRDLLAGKMTSKQAAQEGATRNNIARLGGVVGDSYSKSGDTYYSKNIQAKLAENRTAFQERQAEKADRKTLARQGVTPRSKEYAQAMASLAEKRGGTGGVTSDERSVLMDSKKQPDHAARNGFEPLTSDAATVKKSIKTVYPDRHANKAEGEAFRKAVKAWKSTDGYANASKADKQEIDDWLAEAEKGGKTPPKTKPPGKSIFIPGTMLPNPLASGI